MMNSKETRQLPIGASVPHPWKLHRGCRQKGEEDTGEERRGGASESKPPGDAAQGPEFKLMQM